MTTDGHSHNVTLINLCQVTKVMFRQTMQLCIGVGDRGGGRAERGICPQNFGENIFLENVMKN